MHVKRLDTHRFVLRIAAVGAVVVLAASCQPGYLYPYAGTGRSGDTGDGGSATHATLTTPSAVTMTRGGDVIVVDDGACVIRRIHAGAISTIAGTGTCGFSGDGGAATAAQIDPTDNQNQMEGGIDVDAAGDVIFADSGNGRIRKVTPEGTISTVADGFGTFPNAVAQVVVGPDDTLYATLEGAGLVRVATDGSTTKVADGIFYGLAARSDGQLIVSGPDGVQSVDPDTGQLTTISTDNTIDSVTVDAEDRIYGVNPTQVYRFDGATETILAGSGSDDPGLTTYYGDGHGADLSPLGVYATPHNGLLISSGHVLYRLVNPGATVARLPGAPTDVTATAGVGEATVSWTPPADTGDYPVTGSTVTADPGGATCTTDGTSCTVTGLTKNTAYTFTVTATTIVGSGPASAPSASVTVTGVPDPPTLVRVVAYQGLADVTWTVPTDDGGSPVTNVTATADPGGLSCSAPPERARTCTIEGLTIGQTYTVSLTATNAIGDSAPSAPSAPFLEEQRPDPPTDVVAVPGNGQATVSWTAPASTGGGPIIGYTATSTPGGFTCSTTGATSCIVTGLVNGTAYTFSVVAENALTTSSVSSGSNAVTPSATAGAPSAPTAVQGTAGAGQIAVTWGAPTNDGGSTITGYMATAQPGGATCSTAGTLGCTITGLTNGTTYSVSVVATNVAGAGPAATVDGLTPLSVPGAPTEVTGASGDGQVTVAWNAPFDDGGRAITGYVATAQPGGATCTTTGTLTCPITGLTNFTSYTITVQATNTVGTGPAGTAATHPVPFPAPTYLPRWAAHPSDVPWGITDSGVTVGGAATDDGYLPIYWATATSTPQPMAIPAGFTSADLYGMTPGGVAYGDGIDADGNAQPIVWPSPASAPVQLAVPTTLQATGGWVVGANASGQIVGQVFGTTSGGVDFNAIVYWASTSATAQVVSYEATAAFDQVPLAITDAGGIVANDISAGNWVDYWATPTSAMTRVPTPTGYTAAQVDFGSTGGTLVGHGTDAGGVRQNLYWSSPTAVPTVVPAGDFAGEQTFSVSASGLIVGFGIDPAAGGADVALLWPSPTSDPVAMTNSTGNDELEFDGLAWNGTAILGAVYNDTGDQDERPVIWLAG